MDQPNTPSLNRRATLKGAALVAGAVWVAPLVQVISMQTASAASAPPARVGSDPAGPPQQGGKGGRP